MSVTWKLREWLQGHSAKLRCRRRRMVAGKTAITLESLERRVVPVSPGTVTGSTFIDANSNGTFDTGEIPVTGLVVRLTGNSEEGGNADVAAEATTNADGQFTFISVPAGTYTLAVEPGIALTGGSISINDVTVADTEVTRNVAVGTLRPERLSLRQFLTTSPPFGSPENSPFVAPGGGHALATNDAPIQRVGADTEVTVAMDSAPTTVDLVGIFDDPNIASSQIQIHTTLGDLNVELFDKDAPKTVENFYEYIKDAKYDNTIFHRLPFTDRNTPPTNTPADDTPFVLQGGGFEYNEGPETFTEVATDPAVENEFSAMRSNLAGTIAMAKTGAGPNTATSQFFFNLGDNSANLDNQNGGFTVFGRLVGDEDTAILNDLTGTSATSPVERFDAVKKDALQNAVTSATETTITVTSASAFPVATPFVPFVIRIDNESMQVTSVAGTTFTVTRGTNGSLAATHVVNSVVTLIDNLFGNFGDLPLNDFQAGVAPLALDANRNQRTPANFPTNTTPKDFLQTTSIDTIFRDDFLDYSLVSNSNMPLVTAAVANHRLSLTYAAGMTGTAAIVVRAADQNGEMITATINVTVN